MSTAQMEHAATPQSIREMFDLSGEAAVVTGAGSGLGKAIAEILAQAGANVGLIDVDQDRIESVAAGIAACGGKTFGIAADVSAPESIASAVEGIRGRFGRLDIAFANAGISRGPGFTEAGGTLTGTPQDDWNAVIDVNLNGVFNTLKAVSGRIADGGRIVVTASTAGFRADPMVGYAYVATKAAVLNIVRQAALELAPRGVRINAIAPGPFRTNIAGEGALDVPELNGLWAQTIPLGRMADPEEMKGLALLLASRASSFMTGGAYVIDGGALALSHAR
ncbi:SDR family NAD(P)-dependent oxidoreductase [Arthrobacter mangrovi]|uniref:Short-chain dehydrogenase n=1 Tax=Arthrobacter mangrovi TaxID=2966350 RepID=A0ABQ5MPI1_9MICC|nr:SDR family oxidoreductase [Arthrobacter mangrovi]GLB65906.1 short-chain dehydrogenase [Arthrobacter mangrovi]